MPLVPLYDRVLLKQDSAESRTASGIVIPESAKERPNTGTIVAVGEGLLLDNGDIKPPRVAVGDRVVFQSYAGSELEVDGESLLLLTENDILGIIVTP